MSVMQANTDLPTLNQNDSMGTELGKGLVSQSQIDEITQLEPKCEAS